MCGFQTRTLAGNRIVAGIQTTEVTKPIRPVTNDPWSGYSSGWVRGSCSRHSSIKPCTGQYWLSQGEGKQASKGRAVKKQVCPRVVFSWFDFIIIIPTTTKRKGRTWAGTHKRPIKISGLEAYLWGLEAHQHCRTSPPQNPDNGYRREDHVKTPGRGPAGSVFRLCLAFVTTFCHVSGTGAAVGHEQLGSITLLLTDPGYKKSTNLELEAKAIFNRQLATTFS